MDIDTMEAGRELDALIAEEVMGFAVSMDGCDKPRIEEIINGRSRYDVLPPYSTSISAAWEVVEKIKSMGLAVWLGFEGGRWQAIFGIENKYVVLPEAGGDYEALAPTAPLAICRAALRAVASNL
jgi:hypothetical protein